MHMFQLLNMQELNLIMDLQLRLIKLNQMIQILVVQVALLAMAVEFKLVIVM